MRFSYTWILSEKENSSMEGNGGYMTVLKKYPKQKLKTVEKKLYQFTR